MSKIREQHFDFPNDLPPHADGPLTHWVVYTQKKLGAPHRFAGYIDAPDPDLAMRYAREHYGQDEPCVSIWMHPNAAITSTGYTEEPIQPSSEPQSPAQGNDIWIVFTQKARGGLHIQAGEIAADSTEVALSAAIANHADGRIVNIHIVPQAAIFASNPTDVIWREHDQSYRLAKGYTKDVRTKWDAVRARGDVDRYAQDDVKEHF
jgi:ring-1,2-phenylacetyl-CoA epoxidase subunit PaaB